MTFQAVPVFGADEDAHAQVIVHPMSVEAKGSANNNPIDAGNYYMTKDKDTYPASDDVIYAHEYGHLLGMPDEYSQSNEQLNPLLHQAAPKSAPSAMASLDRATVERMTLAALKRPLSDQLDAMLPDVTKALLAARPKVRSKMAAAAKEGVKTAEVRDALEAQLTARSEGKVSKSIPKVVAFETTTNYGNKDLAKEGVAAGFNTADLRTFISDAYWKALGDPLTKTVAIKDYGDVRINVKDSVTATTATGGAQAGAATGFGATAIGSPSGPGLPAVMPSASLSGELSGIPATWATAGSALETSITPAAFASRVAALIEAAGALQTLMEMIPGSTPEPKVKRTKALYERAYATVTAASKEAAQQLAADLLSSSIKPILQASVTSLQSTVAAEVGRIMTTTPTGLAAAAPDPNMAAVVAGMKARLDADKAATSGTKLDPLAKSGATAPDQDVTYSYQGLMGSNKSTELRADQFQSLVDQFNKKGKSIFESTFTAETK